MTLRAPLACLFALCAATSSCTDGSALPPDRSAIPVEVSVRFRRSCNGTDQQTYDTTCLAAVRLVARTEGKNIVRCETIDERPANLREFIRAETPYISFGTFTDRGEISLALQGLHDVRPGEDGGVSDPCASGADESTWLFFGESKPVDLASFAVVDAGVTRKIIEIPIDCRDCTNGCETLGTPVCPVNRTSFCVPASENLTCEKPCADDDACFEQALTCDLDLGRCEQDSAQPGEFCEACTSDADCDAEGEYSCVGLPTESVGLCARTCPRTQCPNGSICKQLFHNLRRIDGTPVDAGAADAGDDDGGVPDSGVTDGGVTDGGAP
jgi:hypothetical protein